MSTAAPAPEAIREQAKRIMAEEREPRPDPTAVRIPPDTKRWYVRHAAALTRSSGSEVTTHRALVIGLEAYRAAVEAAEAAEAGQG